MQKMTRRERSEKIYLHQQIVEKLKYNPLVMAWLDFQNKSIAEQMEIRELWNKYYLQVKNSNIHTLYMEAKSALLANDSARLNDLASQARQMLVDGYSETDAPDGVDPMVLERSSVVDQYDRSSKLLEILTGQSGIEALL